MKSTDDCSATKQSPKKQGLRSRLGTVMGRRQNPTPPPVPSAEKAKKDRNRSSFMPFRRGDSSRSQQESESKSTMGRHPTTTSSVEQSQQAEPSTQRFFEDENRLPLPTIVDQQQNVATDLVALNGTNAMVDHAGTTTNGASFKQTTSSSNALIPSNQVIPSGIPYKPNRSLCQPPHELSVTPPSPVQHMDAISRAQQEAAASRA